jgi:hypothetical protein
MGLRIPHAAQRRSALRSYWYQVQKHRGSYQFTVSDVMDPEARLQIASSCFVLRDDRERLLFKVAAAAAASHLTKGGARLSLSW